MNKIALVVNNDKQWIGGVYYILNLIKTLDLLPDDEKPEIILVVKSDNLNFFGYGISYNKLNILKGDVNPSNGILKYLNRISGRIIGRKVFRVYFKEDVDLVFPYPVDSLYFRKVPESKRVYWIPDLQEYHYPNNFTHKVLRDRQMKIHTISQSKGYLILSSQSVQNDFKSRLSKNVNLKQFVFRFPVILDMQVFMSKRDISSDIRNKEFFYIPNQFWPHKNQLVAIKALKTLRAAGFDFRIVFTGLMPDTDYVSKLRKYVKDDDLEDVVLFRGIVDREEQLLLYRYSKCVIQTSKFEGWSTSIEEAKALNKMLIVTNLEVHREQLGDNAFFFEPDDDSTLAEFMKHVLLHNKLVEYNYAKFQMSQASVFLDIVKTISENSKL